MLKYLKFSVAALALSTSASLSHEFWIDPLDFTIAPDQPVIAANRVGENFKGSPYAYIPENFRLFELALGDERVAVEGRIGDRPALKQAPLGEGLNVILHVSRDYDLTWDSWEEFTSFVEHKDLEGVVEQHRAKGYPEDGVVEIYARFGKSLVAVGDGAGQDRAYGLETEIVALANPYTDDLTGGLPIRVLYDGAPRSDVQVEIFSKNGQGSVSVTTARTDAAGEAIIPITSGNTYLLDAVVIRPPSPDKTARTGAQWETLWASLTFEAPAD